MKIYLIGFMGSGKSFLGPRIATALECTFWDLDDLIEQKAGQAISAIFENEGETHFRLLEKQTLQETTVIPSAVISTGGGAACFFDNMEWMNQHGLTIYLQTPATLLAARLQAEMEHRPLLAHLSPSELIAFIENKLAEREIFYTKAQVIWEQQKANESDWASLIEKIQTFLPDHE